MADDQQQYIDVTKLQPADAAPQQGAAPQTASQPQAGAQQQQPASNTIDITQLKPLPPTADGSSPLTPLNQSPLKIEDRYKLSLGDEKGNMDYLKSRYQAVEKDPQGNLVVKDQGTWHRVDGRLFGDVDAWTATKGVLQTINSSAMYTIGLATDPVLGTDLKNQAMLHADGNPVSSELYRDPIKYMMAGGKAAASLTALAIPGGSKIADSIANSDPTTKELVSKYAESIPALGKLGAQVLAAQATGGGSLLAQAGVAASSGIGAEGLRTSLGRLEGTYQAPPEQQAKDLAFEGALNAMGVVIPAGVKMTAVKLAEKFPGMGRAYNSMATEAKDAMKYVYGEISGVGAKSFDTFGEQAPRIGNELREVGQIAGTDDGAAADEFVRRKITQVKSTVAQAPQIRTELYQKMQGQLLKSVGSDFSAGAADLTHDATEKLVSQGFATFKTADGELMSAADALSHVADLKAGVSVPDVLKDAKLVIRPQDEILQSMQAGGADINSVGFDKQAHKMLGEFVDTVEKMRQFPKAEGASGANQLLNANKVLDDITYKLKLQADDAGIGEISRRMSEFHGDIRGAIEKAFEKPGQSNPFTAMQTAYSSVKDQLADVEAAAFKASRSGSDTPYMNLVNKITSRGGKNVTVKDSFNGVLKIAQDYGLSSAESLRDTQTKLRIIDAAEKFYPKFNPQIGKRAAQAAAAAGATSFYNPAAAPYALAAGATAVGTSPRVAYKVAQIVEPLWAGKDMLTKLGADGVKELFSDPAMTNAFFQSMINAPALQQQTTSKLLAPLQGQQQQQQPPGGQ